MTMNDEDDDLKANFRQLRAQQETGFPGFRSILNRETRATNKVDRGWIKRDGWIPGLALAAVATAFFWIVTTEKENQALEKDLFVDGLSRPDAFVLGHLVVGEWSMATDSLLDLSALPGDELLDEFPEIGTLPIQGPDGAQNESSNTRIPA